MKKLILLVTVLAPALCWAGSIVLPSSNAAPNPSYSRTLTLGTKGYANYSTNMRDAVRFKGATAAGVATAVKVFLNGDETYSYPVAEDTYTIDRRNVSKIGFRAYSTATPVNVHVWGW